MGYVEKIVNGKVVARYFTSKYKKKARSKGEQSANQKNDK